MGLFSWVKKVPSKLAGATKAVLGWVLQLEKDVAKAIPDADVAELLNTLQNVAMDVVAGVVADMRDGKIELDNVAAELAHLCKPIAKDWAQRIADLNIAEIIERYDEDTLLRYLEIARTITLFVDKFDGDTLPASTLIYKAVDTAIIILNAGNIAGTLKR